MNDVSPHIDRLNAALEGRYRIDGELGEGGMATVYLADDLKHERKVAVKVLKPELAAAFVMLVAGFGLSQLGTPDATPVPSARFAVVGDSTHRIVSPCCGRAVAVSPDGSRLVYQGSSGNTMQLYQRPLDEEVGIPIPGTEEGRHPFFSPDGEWLGFFADDVLKKVRFDGGTPLTITADVGGANAGAAWSEQGEIVFAYQGQPALLKVSADGGNPEVITALDTEAGESAHRWPHFLPGGETVLFDVTIGSFSSGPQRHLIGAVPVDGGAHDIIGDGSDPRFVDSGHLVYGDGAESVMAQPFDARRLELEGSRFRIAEGVTYRGAGSGTTEYDISRTGTLFFRKGGGGNNGGDRTLELIDMDGNVEAVTTLGPIRHPRFSPSGRYIAYELEGVGSSDNGDDAWVWDLQRSVQSRVTFDDDNSFPIWAGDDDRLIFETSTTISTRAADGSGTTEVLYELNGANIPHLTPDGEWLMWTQLADGGDIWVAPVDGSGEPRPLVQTPFAEFAPVVSPDGRWIAYTSDESGVFEIYVEPFPDRGAKFKLTSGGAFGPVWSPSGDRLYYRRENPPARDLMAVEVRAGDEFDVGTHEPLFETGAYPRSFAFRQYDLSPDGTHFVFVRGRTRQRAALAHRTS